MACCDNIPHDSIQLTQGDDSNAMGNFIEIDITSDEDMTGWYAIVQLENFQWRYDDLTVGTLEWVISRDITAQLTVGGHYAAIKVFDSNDLCRTVKKDISVYVNKQVVANPVVPDDPDEPTEG